MKIIKVEPRDNYLLTVFLDNGSSINLNLKTRLETIRFGLLEDENFFKGAETDGMFIYWGNKVELSVGEVLEMIKK